MLGTLHHLGVLDFVVTESISYNISNESPKNPLTNGIGPVAIWAFCQKIYAMQYFRSSLKNPRIVEFKAVIYPLPVLQLEQFFYLKLIASYIGTQICN